MKLKKDTPVERLWNGIYTENPSFVLILGMCPALAVTTSATNAIGMGLSTLVVLALSNLFISLLRNIIPAKMRMPAYIVVIASFVTIVQLLMEGFLPELNKALGLYIPLIVVNCIIMGRAEAYAGKKPPVASFFDGIGMGLGFTLAILLVASLREILGNGTWFGIKITPASYVPINIFVLAPGAFLVFALFVAIMNKLKIGAGRRDKRLWDPTLKTCGESCFSCMKADNCSGKEAVEAAQAEKIIKDVQKKPAAQAVKAEAPKAAETVKAEGKEE
ncbi:MAG: electron transport complex subunit E [Eubacterium sp.]|nr:electron transport complex subunit E [Eubacterium sp.]